MGMGIVIYMDTFDVALEGKGSAYISWYSILPPKQTHKNPYLRLLCPWNSSGKDTGVGSHSLLQGIFPTQGSNSGLLHCRQILYHLSHQEGPKSKSPTHKIIRKYIVVVLSHHMLRWFVTQPYHRVNRQY